MVRVALVKVGDKKIETLKAVRTATGWGLKESKEVTDTVISGKQAVLILNEDAAKKFLDEIHISAPGTVVYALPHDYVVTENA